MLAIFLSLLICYKEIFLCWQQYIVIIFKYFKMVHFSGIIGANYTTGIMPSTVRLQVHSLHQSTIIKSFVSSQKVFIIVLSLSLSLSFELDSNISKIG